MIKNNHLKRMVANDRIRRLNNFVFLRKIAPDNITIQIDSRRKEDQSIG